jgi:hypothetical protein
MPEVTGAANGSRAWGYLEGNFCIFAHFGSNGVLRQIDPSQVTNEWEKTFLLVLFRCSLKEGFSGCVRPETGPKRQKTG